MVDRSGRRRRDARIDSWPSGRSRCHDPALSHLACTGANCCDRVAIFVRGTVVAHGAPHALATESKGPEQVEVHVGADEAELRAILADKKFLRGLQPGRIPRATRSRSSGGTPTNSFRRVEAVFPITASAESPKTSTRLPPLFSTARRSRQVTEQVTDSGIGPSATRPP